MAASPEAIDIAPQPRCQTEPLGSARLGPNLTEVGQWPTTSHMDNAWVLSGTMPLQANKKEVREYGHDAHKN